MWLDLPHLLRAQLHHLKFVLQPSVVKIVQER